MLRAIVSAVLLLTSPLHASAVAERTVEHAENLPIQDGPPPTTIPSWARCGQWWETAKEAGWQEEQMRTLDYVMYRESRCQPNAYNRSGAKGLTQLLGWSCPPNGCFDPLSNLTKARWLFEQSGWRPWCLRGDPVTGNC